MADVLGGQGFPLPQVANVLAPYIKTRQEASRIRRILSVYLESNIEGVPAGTLSATSLAAPGEGVQVVRIPSALSGLRRSYLKALQAHAKARKEYAQLTRDFPHDTKAARQKERQDGDDSRESINVHLALTREQQRIEKLRILQDYLEVLSQKEAARPDYLQMHTVLKGVGPPPEAVQTLAYHAAPGSTSEIDIQALTTRLEKTVLIAKHALDNQRTLLENIRKDQQSQQIPGQTMTISTRTRIDALSRSRDELIDWIEEHLAKTSQSNDTTDESPTPDSSGVLVDIEKRIKVIQDKYEDYIEARKSLVALISSRESIPSQEIKHNPINREPQPQDQRRDRNWHEASSVLPYLTEYLIPTANAQKSFLRQESHFSSTLASQNNATVQVLNRLAEESHLLPSYPILAKQPRFQNVVAALRSKSSPSAFGETTDSENESELIGQARQWAFAADAARSAKQEAVKERLDHGNVHLSMAKSLVEELQEIIGVEKGGSDEAEAEEDIWTESVVTKCEKQTDSGDHTGIWAGLDGRIGIETGISENEL